MATTLLRKSAIRKMLTESVRKTWAAVTLFNETARIEAPGAKLPMVVKLEEH